ncbi:MAG: hypothetical protein AB7N65_28660 [Vicinamibacterales bacterium]
MKHLLHRFLLACVVLSQAGCLPEHVPTSYLLFLDLTGSVSPAQGAAWLTTVDALLERLTFGDTIAVLPITDRTLDAAPLFRKRVADEGQSLDDLAGAQASLEHVRTEAAAAVRAALAAPARANTTDVFAVVDKIAQAVDASSTPPRIFVFSDFLDSAASDVINLEKTPLPMEELPAMVAEVQRRHGWAPDTLRGATIVGVLNGVNGGKRPPVNDRRVLHAFWGSLFGAVGGELAQFDTYVTFN